MSKDYYKILNIDEFSTAEQIKSAYRHLARKWHPDIAGNTPDVLAKFKEINEAYELLSNNIKKADYDTARKFYNYAKSNNTQEQKREYQKETNQMKEESTEKKGKRGFSFNWEEFIAKKYRDAQFKKSNNTSKRGEDIYSDIDISVFEAVYGTVKIINMLQTSVCPKCYGRKFVNGQICNHCKGSGEYSTYKKFNIKIPAGIKDKSKIRLAGEGEKGINGGYNGDLYLVVHIREVENYKVEGLNILKTIQITPEDAVLGAEKEIATVNGNVMLKISPNTQNRQKVRLAGCGIEQNTKRGDMIITIEIQIPKNLTNEEINLYKKLQEIALKKIKNS